MSQTRWIDVPDHSHPPGPSVEFSLRDYVRARMPDKDDQAPMRPAPHRGFSLWSLFPYPSSRLFPNFL